MQHKRIVNLFTVLAILLSWLIFYGIIRFEMASDTPLHSKMLLQYLALPSFPVPPLYYFAIYLVSGFSQELASLNYAATVVMALAVGAKYRATVAVLFQEETFAKLRSLLVPAGAFLMLFAAPVFYDFVHMEFYKGKLATSVWHNSTTIFVMPFVVMMFYVSNRAFSAFKITLKEFGYILGLGVVVLLIKPSFLFAYIPVFALMTLVSFGWRSRSFHLALLATSLLFIGILIQYYVIYLLGPSGVSYNQGESGIAIAPFAFWSLSSRNIPIDTLVSLAYPLTAVLLFGKALLRKKYFQFGALLFIGALILGILLFETGERAAHGNLFWQVVMCNYLLFVCTLKFHLEQIGELNYKNTKVIALSLVFLAHVGSGVLYVMKYFYMTTYI